MEAASKAASRTAQLLTKDTPQEEVAQMMDVMTSIKEQLGKVCVCSTSNSYSLTTKLWQNLNFCSSED